MDNKQFSTPILLLAFKRPETTKLVFEKIRQVKPKELFIVIDGPRNKEEENLVNEVKKIIKVDWKCKVHRLYRKKNLGLRWGIPNAIDWFFKNAEEGIILEDDCVPSKSFFRFCAELLEKYRDDGRIMHISGSNEYKELNLEEFYFFSQIPFIWGWATWRRAWKKYDGDIKDYPKIKRKNFRQMCPNPLARICFRRDFNLISFKNFNTWDYQWVFSLNYSSGLSIVPTKNLIQNIGMERGSTNMKESDKLRSIPSKKIQFPLIHPTKFLINKEFDNLFFRRYFFRKISNWINRKTHIFKKIFQNKLSKR